MYKDSHHSASQFPLAEVKPAAPLKNVGLNFHPGGMRKPQRFRGAVAILALFVLAGCAPYEMPPSAPPQVSVTTLTMRNLELSEELPGRVLPVRMAEIRAQVSGIVQGRLFEQGAEIKEGQGLFQINAAPFKAEVDVAAAALRRAESVLVRAREQATRLEPLVSADAISRQVYDDAVAQRDQAAADVAQAAAALARRELDLKFALVDAPISGRIDQTFVTEGALVGPSDANPMARIQQIDEVYVDVRQPASTLDAWRSAFATREAAGEMLSVVILQANGEPYDLTGRVLFSGINVEPSTGDLLIRVLVANPKRELLPGMFVRTRVPRGRYTDALTVPQQAVVRSGGRAFVWVVDAGNKASLSPVELGERVDQTYRLISGPKAGQKIVVEGMDRLAEGTVVVPSDWQSPDNTNAQLAH